AADGFFLTGNQVMAITDWPAAERPREKLLARGAHALSDAELLAIFLRTGVTGKTAVDLARELLENFGGLRPLLEADSKHFCAAHGLGSAKYAQLQAVLEMARRHLQETLQAGDALTSPHLTRRQPRLQLQHEIREVFAGLYLCNQQRLLAYEAIAHGTIDTAAIYPREVLQRCLQQRAAAVIFAHNHPSGIAEPSQSDRRLTERLRDALALVDIRVLDHIVVGDGTCTSFAERGWL